MKMMTANCGKINRLWGGNIEVYDKKKLKEEIIIEENFTQNYRSNARAMGMIPLRALSESDCP